MTNEVTQERIDKILDEAERQEKVFWGEELVVSYKLKNGFLLIAGSPSVESENFDLEAARKVARKNAEYQLWELEEYSLKEKLFGEK